MDASSLQICKQKRTEDHLVLPEAGAPGTLTARKENNKLNQEASTVLYRSGNRQQQQQKKVVYRL